MLKPCSIFLAVALCMAVAFWALEYSFSDSFQTCIDKYADANRAEAAKKNDHRIGVFVVLGTHTRCTVRLLGHHHGALTALATLLIAGFTAILWVATRGAAQNFTVSERAYVKISHIPPGMTFDEANECVWVIFEVKNLGKTPGTITDFFTDFVKLAKDKSLPEPRSYAKPKDHVISDGFLVAQDFYYVPRSFPFNPIHRPVINSGEEILWVYGYVDYRDQFGVCHRAGYARVYSPHNDQEAAYPNTRAYEARSNLVFPQIRGWNYDETPPRESDVRDKDNQKS